MTEHYGSPDIEDSLPVQILNRTLDALAQDSAFDEACISRLRALATEGRMSRPDRVIVALEGPDPG